MIEKAIVELGALQRRVGKALKVFIKDPTQSNFQLLQEAVEESHHPICMTMDHPLSASLYKLDKCPRHCPFLTKTTEDQDICDSLSSFSNEYYSEYNSEEFWSSHQGNILLACVRFLDTLDRRKG